MLAGTDPAFMVLLAMIVTRTLPVPSVLAAVLAGDGITLPGHRAEHAIACFNPHHRDDAAKAMRIDTVRGGLPLLRVRYPWELLDLSDPDKGPPATGRRGVARGAGLARRASPLVPRLAPRTGAREIGRGQVHGRALHDGRRTQRRAPGQSHRPARLPARRRAPGVRPLQIYEGIHRRIPKCLTFTPSHRGGWWEALPNSTSVPTEDRHAGGLPLHQSPSPGIPQVSGEFT